MKARSNMMQCQKCGRICLLTDKCCPNCGYALENTLEYKFKVHGFSIIVDNSRYLIYENQKHESLVFFKDMDLIQYVGDFDLPNDLIEEQLLKLKEER